MRPYAISREEVLTLMDAVTPPEELRDRLVEANVYLSIVLEEEILYRLNTAVFLTVPDDVLLDLYVALKRFCTAYVREKKQEKRRQLLETFCGCFLGVLPILKEG